MDEQGTPSGRPDPAGQQGQPGGQQQPGESRGGAGPSPNGGGGKAPGDPGAPIAPSAEEKAKPGPRAEAPPLNSGETVAPDVPQSELVLQKLDDLLKKNQVTPELEQATGMSREQMEQFVTKFKKAPKAAPGEGREIRVKPGQDRAFSPNRSLPELNPNARVGRTVRDRGSVAQDEVRDNAEGARFEVPLELRQGYEAYKSSISGAKSTRPAAPGSGGH